MPVGHRFSGGGEKHTAAAGVGLALFIIGCQGEHSAAALGIDLLGGERGAVLADIHAFAGGYMHHAADNGGHFAAAEIGVGTKCARFVRTGEHTGPVEFVHSFAAAVGQAHIGDGPVAELVHYGQRFIGQGSGQEHGKLPPGNGVAVIGEI